MDTTTQDLTRINLKQRPVLNLPPQVDYEDKAVEMAVTMRAKGVTLRRCADVLTDMGYRSPKGLPLGPGQVYRMLTKAGVVTPETGCGPGRKKR